MGNKKSHTELNQHCKETGEPPGCCCGSGNWSDEDHVTRGIVMVEPDRAFYVSLHSREPVFQSLECLKVKGWVDSFSLRLKNQNVWFLGQKKKTISIVLIFDLRFLGRGDDFVCHSLVCRFDSGWYSIIRGSSLLTTELRKFGSFWIKSNNPWYREIQSSFWSSVNTFGASFVQTLRICRFSVTIPCTAN